MIRAFGVLGIPLIECINPEIKKYRIRYDIQKYPDEEYDNTISFMEDEILHKPTLSEVKNIVLKGYNSIVDEKILSGFKWNDISVWLSTENQFNYKAAYDLAFQTNGASLPTVFKFGTNENPIYYKFDTLDELQDFYIKAMTYINEQLAIGWAKKDSIDWSEYEKYLK